MASITKHPLHWVLKAFFYGNYFYGLCVLAFIYASRKVLGNPILLPFFDSFLMLVSIIGYQLSYIRVSIHPLMNERSRWYLEHARAIRFVLVLEVVFALSAAYQCYLMQEWHLGTWPWWYWVLGFSVPLSGAFYNGFGGFLPRLKVRQLGILKPLSIAYVWVGVGVLFPYLMQQTIIQHQGNIPSILIWMIVDAFFYIVILSVLFDIKDVSKDANLGVRTLPIRLGLHKTYTYILWPLIILNSVVTMIGTYIFFSNVIAYLWAMLPYIALIVVMRQMYKRQSLLFYLAIVDGLMLIKAISWVLQAYLS